VPEFFDEPRKLSELLRAETPPTETRFAIGDAS